AWSAPSVAAGMLVGQPSLSASRVAGAARGTALVSGRLVQGAVHAGLAAGGAAQAVTAGTGAVRGPIGRVGAAGVARLTRQGPPDLGQWATACYQQAWRSGRVYGTRAGRSPGTPTHPVGTTP